MEKQNRDRSHAPPSHRCDMHCLRPLSFHPQAVGAMVQLSHGNRLAERKNATFRNGLVFSNCPVKVREKICVKVLKTSSHWDGSLRVGFTNVPPSGRSLPLPGMAIPDLTNTRGHWAAPLHESFCNEGSELKFWVSTGGNMYVSINQSERKKLLAGLDLSKPLWAMIDIYGQACSIFLMGSEKHGLIRRRSCPAPEPLILPERDTCLSSVPDVSGQAEDCDEANDNYKDDKCAVCLDRKASVTLVCAHRCLCERCFPKVRHEFGTCPLCRHPFGAPSFLYRAELKDFTQESGNK